MLGWAGKHEEAGRAGGDASFILGNDGIGEFSQGTLLNAGGTTYTAGVQSESYFPVGFNPYTEFASFSSSGLVHTHLNG